MNIVSSSFVVRSLPGRLFRTLLRVVGENDVTCDATSLGKYPEMRRWSGLLRMAIFSNKRSDERDLGKVVRKVVICYPNAFSFRLGFFFSFCIPFKVRGKFPQSMAKHNYVRVVTMLRQSTKDLF